MAQSIEEVISKLQEKIQLQAEKQDGSVATEESEPEYECPKCKDQTIIIERVPYIDPFSGEPKYKKDGTQIFTDQGRDCTCISWRRAERLLKSSEITSEFKKLGFQNFRTEGKPEVIKGMHECALAYFQDFENIKQSRRNSISLLGQPGSGKTHLLTAVSNNLMRKKDTSVLYFPYVEGFNDLKDDFNKLEEKLERMKRVDVLFIDDLFKPAKGKPRATDWQVEQTYAVINHRYLNHKPILISSELTVDQLCDVDEALGTRIFEMCKDFTVVVQGDRKLLNHRLED